VTVRNHGTGRILGQVADKRFGPNSAEVEAFLDRLRRLTPAQWEDIKEASPSVGAIPELEVEEAPEYFSAFREATRVAKSNVFPGSESAFFDAMRTAQLIADASTFQPSTQPEPASAVVEGVNLPPDLEAEAISRVMSTAYEEESWRRVMNACMVAAGALVVKRALGREAFGILTSPIRVAARGKATSP
jgi:hypothetical protein